MLGRAAGVRSRRLLQRADGMLAIPEKLQDPDAGRMPQRAKERRFGHVERGRFERHTAILEEVKTTQMTDRYQGGLASSGIV